MNDNTLYTACLSKPMCEDIIDFLLIEVNTLVNVQTIEVAINGYHKAVDHYRLLYLDLCKKLINKFPKLNPNDEPTFFLLNACMLPPELFIALVEKGFDPNIQSKTNTCLTMACAVKNTALVEILLTKYHLDPLFCVAGRFTTPQLPIVFCAKLNDMNTFKLLLPYSWDAKIAHSGESLLISLVSNRSPLVFVKLLIETHSVDINYETKNGWTVLNYAARYGTYETCVFLVGKSARPGKTSLNLWQLAQARNAVTIEDYQIFKFFTPWYMNFFKLPNKS